MKQITVNAYTFDELSDQAKQKVLNEMSDINTDYEWWDSVYNDAETIGIEIKTFDIDRGDIDCIIADSEETANLILKNHGESCKTYSIASNFLEKKSKLVKKYSNGIETEKVTEDNYDDFDSEWEELMGSFDYNISKEYLKMLSDQYEFLQSEEAIIETIQANEYLFTKNGERKVYL